MNSAANSAPESEPAARDPGRRLRRAYFFARLAGYLCGIAGALLMFWGRRRAGGGAAAVAGIGAALLIVMFLLFAVSYALALSGALRRRLPR